MDVIHLLSRWLHVWFGIIWVGHLYFFNFVNIPLQGALDDAGKKIVNPQLMPRALFWFRWGAMMTFVFGWVLYVINYMYVPGEGFGPNALFHSGRHAWILWACCSGPSCGSTCGSSSGPETALGRKGRRPGPAIRTKAAMASRVNTYLWRRCSSGCWAPALPGEPRRHGGPDARRRGLDLQAYGDDGLRHED